MGLKKNGKDVTVDFAKDAEYVYRPSVTTAAFVLHTYRLKGDRRHSNWNGNDGLIGLRELKRRNGLVSAQDDETCVVFGMPKAVIYSNIADVVLQSKKSRGDHKSVMKTQ